MDRIKTARNVSIVVAIAAAVYFLPGGGRAASTFESALWVLFSVAIAYFGVRLYREHRVAIHSLGDRRRAMLYGSIAVIVFAWVGRVRMWETGLGEILWFVLIGGVIYAAMDIYRQARSY